MPFSKCHLLHCCACLLLGVILTSSLAMAGQANVFIYHRFGDSRYPSTNISLEDFRSHLDVLKKKNIKVTTLGELVDLLKSGEPLAGHYAVLTVDDGYKSFLTGAMPILREYGYPVTLFVNTDAVGGHGYLGWPELVSLAKEGVELGNHTASHPHLTDLLPGESRLDWQERLKADLEKAKEVFRANLSLEPDLFAYPYGEYSPEVQQLVRDFDFKAAIAQQSGVVTESSDLFALPRFPMGGPYTSSDQFQGKLLMRALPVERLSPETILVTDTNPPVLEVRIASSLIDLSQLSCYVSGQDQANIEKVDGKPGHYRVQAKSPLQGRRSKYTLTAPGTSGGWYWFSQLWIRPDVEEGGY